MSYLNRSKRWILNGKDFWYALFAIGGILPIRYFCSMRCEGVDYLRFFGIGYGLIGLFIVVQSLAKESKKYNQPSYLSALWVWGKSVKEIFIIPPKSPVHLSVELGAKCSFSADSSFRSGATTVDEKVDYLIKAVEILQQNSVSFRAELDEKHRAALEKIERLKSELSAHSQQVNQNLRDIAVLNFYLLVSGAIITAFGIILTGAPDSFLKFILAQSSLVCAAQIAH